MSSKIKLNKVTLIGNLTRDPELKYTPQGTAVCKALALLQIEDGQLKTGETKEDVQFHRIVALAKLAELCANLLAKGTKKKKKKKKKKKNLSWRENYVSEVSR